MTSWPGTPLSGKSRARPLVSTWTSSCMSPGRANRTSLVTVLAVPRAFPMGKDQNSDTGPAAPHLHRRRIPPGRSWLEARQERPFSGRALDGTQWSSHRREAARERRRRTRSARRASTPRRESNDLRVGRLPERGQPEGFEGETQGSCAGTEVETPKTPANPTRGRKP